MNIETVALQNVTLALSQAREIFNNSKHKNTSGTREIVMLAQIILEEKHRMMQTKKDEQNGTN